MMDIEIIVFNPFYYTLLLDEIIVFANEISVLIPIFANFWAHIKLI